MVIEGFYLEDEPAVFVNEQRLTPDRSLTYRQHSPTGFAWGYGGSGPAQLALAILLESGIGTSRALALYQDFKWEYIATLPTGDRRWYLRLDVEAWAQARERARREATP